MDVFSSSVYRYKKIKIFRFDYNNYLIIDIDASTKTLTCEERAVQESEHRIFTCNYDKLVVTIGADNNTYNIPGVRENTYFLKVHYTRFISVLQNVFFFFSTTRSNVYFFFASGTR